MTSGLFRSPAGAGWPVVLPVDGRPILVVGGGAGALGPVGELLRSGARVVVLAEQLSDALTDLSVRGHIEHRLESPAAIDLAGFWLVVAADGRPEVDAAVAERAAAARRFCLMAPGVSATKSSGGGPGRVVLVGGGPGDPGLITVAGLAAVRSADVLVVDRLAPLALLGEAPPGCEVLDVAKIPRGRFTPQEEINRLLIDRAQQGRTVVRLKGGDIFVFGRGGEEWQACVAAGIAVELIPGVTSAVAGPALAGIPVTHRTASQGFTVISGHVPPDDAGSTLDWSALARAGTTLVVMMGMRNLAAIATALIAHGLDSATPAATIADAGLPGQRRIDAPLTDIADAVRKAGIGAPAITVIGAVAAFDPIGS